MKIFKFLVIEDSDATIDLLQEFLKAILLCEITICTSTNEAVEKLNSQKFDVIILDTVIGDQKGLDFIQLFQNLPPVIIISSNPDYAIDTYDIDCIIDFLTKSFTKERLLKAISRALSVNFNPTNIIGKDEVFLKTGRKITKFAYEDIHYIQAYGVYSKLYISDSIILVNDLLTTLGNTLPTQYFRRVHKSYIINLSKVESIDHNSFYIGKSKVPIGRSYKTELAPLFNMLGSAE